MATDCERRPDDADARINLEIVLRRVQLLADRLNRGSNGLEARLDRLIDDQRGRRDRIRALLGQIGPETAAPPARRGACEGLGAVRRTLPAARAVG